MAEKIEFLTMDDLKDVLDEASTQLLIDGKYEIQEPLQKIKMICGLFEQQYKMISKSETAMQQMYLLGMRIVFATRAFLLQEKITFSVGATSPDGTKLSVKEITQSEVFQNVTANLKSKQIELNSVLEQYDENNISHLSDLWAQVLDAAAFQWIDGYSYTKKQYITSKKKKKYVYNKPNPDTNVWVRYYQRQQKKFLTYYYDKGNFDLVAYNRGWLYEWFQEYIALKHEAYQQQSVLFDFSKPNPLHEMMQGATRENIAGYKGGDYIAAGKQMQAKMNNKRIITFTSLRDVILGNGSNKIGILQIIQDYEREVAMSDKGNSEAKNKMVSRFVSLFTDEHTKINNDYEKIVDDMLTPIRNIK